MMPATSPQAVAGDRQRPAGIVTRMAAMGVDMAVVVIIGASTTRQVGRWVYTPRSERGAP